MARSVEEKFNVFLALFATGLILTLGLNWSLEGLPQCARSIPISRALQLEFSQDIPFWSMWLSFVVQPVLKWALDWLP